MFAGISMQVSKWGNSLAIRLPQAVVEALQLKEGDEIEISVAAHASLWSIATGAARGRWRSSVIANGSFLPAGGSTARRPTSEKRAKIARRLRPEAALSTAVCEPLKRAAAGAPDEAVFR